MTFAKWRATRRYVEDISTTYHWAGPGYEYAGGGFVGVNPLGGLIVHVCHEEYRFDRLDDAERCLWDKWVSLESV